MFARTLSHPHSLQGTRTISFSSGYLTFLKDLRFSNSNTALSEFYQELSQAYGALFGFTSNALHSPGIRALAGAGELWFAWYRANGIITSYHEFGHFTRFKAMGWEDVWFQTPYQTDNIFAFTFYCLTHFSVSASTAANAQTVSTHLPQIDQEILSSAAGVNNSMRLASDLSNALWEGRQSITSIMIYGKGKTDLWKYPLGSSSGNDVNSMLTNYRAKGMRITKAHMDQSNKIALFCSASTYAYMLGWLNFIHKGHTAVPRPELAGIRLPDVEAYCLVEGLSTKIQTGFRHKNFYLPVSVEWLTHGEKGYEISMGAQQTLKRGYGITLGGTLRFGRAFDWDAIVRMPFAQKEAFIEARVEKHSLKSFHGQRNMATTTKGPSAMTFLLRIGAYY